MKKNINQAVFTADLTFFSILSTIPQEPLTESVQNNTDSVTTLDRLNGKLERHGIMSDSLRQSKILSERILQLRSVVTVIRSRANNDGNTIGVFPVSYWGFTAAQAGGMEVINSVFENMKTHGRPMKEAVAVHFEVYANQVTVRTPPKNEVRDLRQEGVMFNIHPTHTHTHILS